MADKIKVTNEEIDGWYKSPLNTSGQYSRIEIKKLLEEGDWPLFDIPSSQWFKIHGSKKRKGGSVKTSKYSKGGGVRKSKYSL